MILLLDDDEHFRTGLADCLQEDGHRVCAYASPSALPELRSLGDIHAAITDYSLKGENGLAFADRLNRERPDVPIIIATAYPEPLLDAAVKKRDFLSLLRKPFRYETLLQILALAKP